MKCSNCGGESFRITDGNYICNKCGTSVVRKPVVIENPLPEGNVILG